LNTYVKVVISQGQIV